jgi:hypothetical protein
MSIFSWEHTFLGLVKSLQKIKVNEEFLFLHLKWSELQAQFQCSMYLNSESFF